MEIYRGDTFKFDFSASLEDGTVHTFEVGDILKVGIKSKITKTDYIIYQEKIIEEATQEVTFEFTHEEMKNAVVADDLIIEVELTDTAGRVSTLYQGNIDIKGDVINE